MENLGSDRARGGPRLAAVYERDCDLVFLEELVASQELLRIFLDALPTSAIPEEPPTSHDAWHSLERTDGSGETDLHVIANWSDASPPLTLHLLIENKVNAEFMPDQPERYMGFAGELSDASIGSLAFSVLLAPRSYLDSHEAEFGARVSYEEVEDYLMQRAQTVDSSEVRSRCLHRRAVLRQAIEKQRRARNRAPTSEEATRFWEGYWLIASTRFASLRMPRPQPKTKGSDAVGFPGVLTRPAWWVGHPPELRHRLTRGEVTLAIEKADLTDSTISRLREALSPNMTLAERGKSVFVTIQVPTLDLFTSVSGVEEEIVAGLSAASVLHRWWETEYPVLKR